MNAGMPASRLSAALSRPGAVAIGRRSYGLYLYGWPSQQLVEQFIAPGGTPLQNTAWATALALSLAAASWFLVERPALRLKKRFGTRTPAASPASAPA